nr:DUF692 family multinuclear iron-containing protein [Ramlibacter cellulosilyticus]
MHGVGHPVGGTVQDPVDPWDLLHHAVRALQPAWVSEHLSFNRVGREEGIRHAGFLFPPAQTAAAVRVAASNIIAYARRLGCPAAFETGVNYLRPRASDMGDGEFFAAVAQASGAGILLDVHNLWCNECNGRESVAEVVATLPLDRVWEIHFAGGMEHSGFRLDAHSGRVPPQVIDIAAALIPRLPRLGALVFEILPEHVPAIGLDGVMRELARLQELWALRSPTNVQVPSSPACTPSRSDFDEVARWEGSLFDAVTGNADPEDRGCALLRGLVDDARRGSLARALRYTTTCLLGALGDRGFGELFAAYCRTHAPEPFASVEAERFAGFLRTRIDGGLCVPYLDEVLAFEHGLLRATLLGASSEVRWSVDPTMLIESLEAGTLPRGLPQVRSVMRIAPGEAG